MTYCCYFKFLVIFFAGPKKTNQKKGPFLARINVIFAFGKTSLTCACLLFFNGQLEPPFL
ncbi:MAG: hypothetical protein CFE24_13215 [Flavobacterium sp. BFFFF2]|nr:MAG: hypothetical protein CFE24_13215 [Flavobacterium sp. BFFFF2]